MKYLKKAHVLIINRRTVDAHGGFYNPPTNLKNEHSLDFLLDAVTAELFGAPMYPEVYDKAAYYLHAINSGHVFQDGTKRAGLGAALIFLNLNGYKLSDELEKNIGGDGKLVPEKGESRDDILTEFVLELASGKHDLATCQLWFKRNIAKQ